MGGLSRTALQWRLDGGNAKVPIGVNSGRGSFEGLLILAPVRAETRPGRRAYVKRCLKGLFCLGKLGVNRLKTCGRCHEEGLI